MRVRTKISLLLVFCVGILATLIIFYRGIEDKRLGVLFRQESEDRIDNIQRVLNVVGNSMEIFAYDYTHWDEMVNFLSTRDRAWAEANIGTSLEKYEVTGVWIYNTDSELLYSADNMGGGFFENLPLPRDTIKGLFEKSRFSHFFIDTPKGPMEIRGATIHKTSDIERKTPPGGFFLVGRIWDKAYMDNLSKLAGAEIRTCTAGEKSLGFIADARNGIITFREALEDWQGSPVACISISSYSGTVKVFMRDSRRMLLVLLLYATALLMILYFTLMVWISSPLGSIWLALVHKDKAHIKGLIGTKDEFGHIANLIDKFFSQRQQLLSEIAEHKRSDEKLAIKMRELEGTYIQLQEMQAKLVQSEKMAALGRFASGVAHEVKNPLGILLGGLEYLKAKLTGADPDVREAMVKMREAVMRADIIIKDLLTFARPSKVVAEVVHPNALIHNAVSFIELFKHKSDTAEINIKQDLTDEEIFVDVDKNQMQQALFNILLNAIEAMPMKGDIFVKTYPDIASISPRSQKAEVCVIEIKDTGQGISKEDMLKIFEPFFTTKRERRGTGLGLSIVKSIIDKNMGAINVHSEIDKGTTVSIILPAVGAVNKGVKK